MANICRFLISEHPGLIREKFGDYGYLPIHMLAHYSNRPIVQEIVILLLKVYPECVHVKVNDGDDELSTIEFIQQVHPLILEEPEIEQEKSMLVQISENITQATALPTIGPALNYTLFDSVTGVFCSWADVKVSEDLPAQTQRIQERIAVIRRDLEGTD